MARLSPLILALCLALGVSAALARPGGGPGGDGPGGPGGPGGHDGPRDGPFGPRNETAPCLNGTQPLNHTGPSDGRPRHDGPLNGTEPHGPFRNGTHAPLNGTRGPFNHTGAEGPRGKPKGGSKKGGRKMLGLFGFGERPHDGPHDGPHGGPHDGPFGPRPEITDSGLPVEPVPPPFLPHLPLAGPLTKGDLRAAQAWAEALRGYADEIEEWAAKASAGASSLSSGGAAAAGDDIDQGAAADEVVEAQTAVEAAVAARQQAKPRAAAVIATRV